MGPGIKAGNSHAEKSATPDLVLAGEFLFRLQGGPKNIFLQVKISFDVLLWVGSWFQLILQESHGPSLQKL